VQFFEAGKRLICGRDKKKFLNRKIQERKIGGVKNERSSIGINERLKP
jgi:hypothetical protein